MAGRPRTFDRDEALHCALESFWRDGYEETSVSALTAAIGIGAPSLYAAFGDKRRLFDEAAAVYVARLHRGVAEELAAPTAREAVMRLLQRTALSQTDPATPPGCLVFSEPLLAPERERVRDAIARRIARGQADGDVPAEADPGELAAFLQTVIAGMSTRARDGGAGYAELAATGRVAAAVVPGPGADPAGR